MSEELKPCPFCGGQLDPTYETFKCCQGCGSEFGCSDETWNNRHTAEIEANAIDELAEKISIRADATPLGEEDHSMGASVYNWLCHFQRVAAEHANQIREREREINHE